MLCEDVVDIWLGEGSIFVSAGQKGEVPEADDFERLSAVVTRMRVELSELSLKVSRATSRELK